MTGDRAFVPRRIPGRGSGFQAPKRATPEGIAPPRLAWGLAFRDPPDEPSALDVLGAPLGFPDPPDAPTAPDLLVKD